MHGVTVLERVRRYAARQSVFAVVAGFLLIGAQQKTHAQAVPGASKAADMAVFGGFSYATPDYGQPKDKGGTIGFDYTRYLRFPISPGLEIRATDVHGDGLNQKTLTAGLRGQFDFRDRFHPYGDLLIGGGVLHFAFPQAPGYISDRGRVYSMGGGVDINITPRLLARVDFQSQNWNLGRNRYLVPNGGDFILTPKVFTVGISYRLPFRPHVRQSDYYR